MTLQKRVKAHLEENNISQAQLGRAIGKSGALISNWLQGKYTGDIAEVDHAVEAWLNRQIERQAERRKAGAFAQTANAVNFFNVAGFCQEEGEFGVIHGDAGLGKTCTAHEYTKQNPGTILIEVEPGYTAKVLLSEIHRKVINGSDGRGTLNNLSREIVERIKGTDRLIIVDEAEHLPYRALEQLRRIGDKSGNGILLVGMTKLIANLTGKRWEYKQIFSRVTMAVELKKLSVDDVEAITRTVFDNISRTAVKEFHRCCEANARRVSKVMKMTRRMMAINSAELDADMVQQASNYLIK